METNYVLVPVELLENLIENTHDLLGEWAWKRRTPGEVELTRMERETAQARELLDEVVKCTSQPISNILVRFRVDANGTVTRTYQPAQQ